MSVEGGGEAEKAILVGAGEGRLLGELGRLAGTLGLEVAGGLEQGRRDNAGYLGRGKREELSALVLDHEANLVVADDELSPSQARNLEKAAGVPVVDRTELIIRIFESHASDRASRLEVELADLEYRLPRIKGRNTALSRLGGGASSGGGTATRGPGEQQLEYDRRVIRERIQRINRRLEEEKSARAVRTARRKTGGLPTVALVGYTNAGKTTILNALSGAGRSTKDRLFETLETTTRLIEGCGSNGAGIGDSRPNFAVTDTVGFIRKLPTQLVHSFASTLEAALDADILVLCADASSPDLADEISTVKATLVDYLGESGLEGKRVLLCLNKMDLVDRSDTRRREELSLDYPDAVAISAVRGEKGPLLDAVYEAISEERTRMKLLIPFSDYAEAAALYGQAEIHARESTVDGVWMDVTLPAPVKGKYAPYRVP